MPSSDSFTEPTTSAPLETSILTQMLDGLSQLARPDNDDGLISILAFATGIGGLRNQLTEAVQSEINSAIESFISTDLMPFLLKQSPGDLKALSQRYVLEVRFGLDERWRGPNCSFRCTIRLYSKFHTIGSERRLLSIELDELLKMRFPTQIL